MQTTGISGIGMQNIAWGSFPLLYKA